MKKPVLVEFKISNDGKLIHFSQLPAGEKDRLDFIAFKAKGLIQRVDCRVHGARHQSMLISVVDGDIDIQVNACCSDYAKDLRKLEWGKIADSFTAVAPGVGGDLFSN